MTPTARHHFDLEINNAKTAFAAGATSEMWNHLARAHILGQFEAWPHLKVHGCMFAYGLLTMNASEIIGQIPRLLLAVPGSVFRRAPLGNSGLSNVGIFQPQEIPRDLQDIINSK